LPAVPNSDVAVAAARHDAPCLQAAKCHALIQTERCSWSKLAANS
jgi:hypothetical protein